MKIFHGSKKIIKEPKYKGSNSENDYGASFYLTFDLEAAKAWACRNDSAGVVNEYDFNFEKYQNLKILDLTNGDKFSVLNWLSILVHFRELDSAFLRKNQYTINWLKKFYINVEEYDVIKGYRADDSYFRFPKSFLNNDLAFEDLEYAFKLGNLGVQYAFMSEKAIKILKFKKTIECEESFVGDYYSKVQEATKVFDELVNQEKDPKKHYILDLIREDTDE